MKILVLSTVYHPSTGGTETAARVLSTALCRLGYDLQLVTSTQGCGPEDAPFRIFRKPGNASLLRLVSQADVVIQHGLGVRLSWPSPLMQTPLVTVLHIEPVAASGKPNRLSLALKDRLRRALLRRSDRVVAVSNYLAARVGIACSVIYNPYDDKVFIRRPGAQRTRDLIFAGRLISEKGASIALAALNLLKRRNFRPTLTIVGDGPDRQELMTFCKSSQLENQVVFKPIADPTTLASYYNDHRIAIVPSLCAESFGLTALESLACGCFPIVSDIGGLPEAIGPFGCKVTPGSAEALAQAIEAHAHTTPEPSEFPRSALQHLESFSSEAIGQQYARLLNSVHRKKH